jgi:branched-chain amino acid transport system substrate-binding protein
VERFSKRWGKAPTGVSALGYDTLMLIADAIRRAGGTEPKSIRAALAATTAFEGVTGRIAIDADRNARKPASIVRVEGGRFRFLQTVTP